MSLQNRSTPKEESNHPPEITNSRRMILSTLKDLLEGGEILRVRYISENSPEYREKIKKVHQKKENIFGSFDLSEYERIKKVIRNHKNWGNDYSQYEEQLKDCFTFSKHKIKELLKSKFSDRRANTEKFIYELLEDPIVLNEFESLLQKGKKDFTALDFIGLFEENKIDDDLFIQMLKCHQKNFNEKCKEFYELAETYKNEYKQRVKEEIELGYLPIDWQTAERRIDETGFRLIDSMNSGEIMGRYSNWIVTIGDTVAKEDLRHFIFHEMTHAISGRVIKEKIFNGSRNEDIWEVNLLENAKLGMHFQNRKSLNGFPEDTFVGVSEAITEEVTIKLLGGVPGDGEIDTLIYFMERGELNRYTGYLSKILKTKDGEKYEPDGTEVPMELFLEAYFESFDPEVDGDEPNLQKCEKLFQMIEERKGIRELEKMKNK